ncbi:MAG: pyridoxamine 5'-phosphate oxidase family protein [Trueperaceae bacterium]|nr:pyridoxamine 5'-phosphate oxidase family protein [Trueperaceae bacterium]
MPKVHDRGGELEELLRRLPAFPDHLPTLDEGALPESPEALFLDWLEDAIESGARQPHAMSFVTSRGDGTPVARTLILKAFDRHGYHFSTNRTSRKGLELESQPRASMLFFWRESGRQVRITGTVVLLDRATSLRDWQQRPTYDGAPNPDWQRYALAADEFEFMQARHDRNHSRIEYLRDDTGWTRGRVPTPAG